MAEITSYSDRVLHNFKKTNLYYAGKGYPLIKYQDPTYIGFKLFFLFDQPESGLLSEEPLKNTALGYLTTIGDEKRAEYLKSFVRLLKGINSQTPWFFQSIEGLDEAWKHLYQEKDFKPILADRKIIINCLDESIDLRMTALMDLYRKACFDWEFRREVVPLNLRRFKVAIYCYEARSINRSGTPNRWQNIPSNAQVGPPLQKKNLKESRQKDYDEVNKLMGQDPNIGETGFPINNDLINPNITRVMFNFEYCEWLPDETNGLFASISHKEMGLKAQKIAFSYREVMEDNQYRMHHDKRVSDFVTDTVDRLALDIPPANETTTSKDPIASDFGKDLKKRFEDAAEAIKERALAPYKPTTIGKIDSAGIDGNIYGLGLLEKQIEKLPQAQKDAARRVAAEALRAAAPIRRLFLGNVWGFSAAEAAAVAQAGAGAAIQAVLQEVGKNASKKNASNDEENPIDSYGQGSPSLINKKGSNKSTDQGSSPENPSLTNDDGPDSTDQGSPIGNASLYNGKKKKPFGKGKFFDDFIPSLSNDNGNDAKSQGSSPENTSLNNG